MKMLAKLRQAVIHRHLNLRGLGTDEPRRHFLEQPVEARALAELFRGLFHPDDSNTMAAEISTTAAEKIAFATEISAALNLFLRATQES